MAFCTKGKGLGGSDWVIASISGRLPTFETKESTFGINIQHSYAIGVNRILTKYKKDWDYLIFN